jgi:hypothetical protein
VKRTDRLRALVLEPQRQMQVRAEDLAAQFEGSRRTTYRAVFSPRDEDQYPRDIHRLVAGSPGGTDT